jgi:CrcB protein
MRALLWVAMGGGAGSALRFGIQRWLNIGPFAWGTLLVNFAGCLLIGMLWAISIRGLSDNNRQLLMSGFCGGFTTLSAFTLESNILLQQGRTGLFFLYGAATLLGGLGATFVGYKMLA